MAKLENGVLLAKTSPAFLHANSTSHTWIFSAIAELIDNAYDPDVHATVLKIDIEHFAVGPDQTTAITFTDNGAGMNAKKLHNMLSFGYCEKVEANGYKPVGQYGNGFKSGSMRIGRDAIVFTKDGAGLSVGMLSQTYLEAINADTILVPILTFDRHTLQLRNKEDTTGSYRAITQHSIFRDKDALMREFENIVFDTGTRIIIYNLKRGLNGTLELDFESNQIDIINSEHHEIDAVYRPVIEYTSEYRRSLREYCSILYLTPRMKIILRDKRVKFKLISRSLKKMQVDTYRPRFLNQPVRITFGFSPTQDYGIILYHRNRLITAYEKVGVQRQGNASVAGIVGVVEADFLEPIHNKQDFDKTDRYNTFMSALEQKLKDYRDFINRQDGQDTDVYTRIMQRNAEPWTWAQCDRCNKWRRLPPGCEANLPEVWFCYMNRDPTHNRCDIDEEPEDEDAIMEQSATYSKFVRRHKTLEKEERSARNKEQESTKDSRSQADLELAKLKLQEAEKREAEQLRIIQMLESENRQWKDKQGKLRKGIMSNQQTLSSINDVARCGLTPALQSPSAATQSSRSRKRHSEPDTSSTVDKKFKVDDSNQPSASTGFSTSDDEDDKEAVRRALVVKLPGQEKQTSNSVIVIDDSDNDSDASTDRPVNRKSGKRPTSRTARRDAKSDIELPDSQTDQVSPKPSTSNNAGQSSSTSCRISAGTARKKGSPNSEDIPSSPVMGNSHETYPTTSNCSFNKKQFKNSSSKTKSGSTSPSTTTDLEPTRCNVAVQTDAPHDKASKKLDRLRTSVLELLKTIVPTLDCHNLEFVDDIVVEMVRVNSLNTSQCMNLDEDDIKYEV